MGGRKKILSCGYGYGAVYDVASSLKEKVSSVLKEKSYVWKPLRSNSLLSIQSKLPLTDIGDVDRPIWVPVKGGIYAS